MQTKDPDQTMILQTDLESLQFPSQFANDPFYMTRLTIAVGTQTNMNAHVISAVSLAII